MRNLKINKKTRIIAGCLLGILSLLFIFLAPVAGATMAAVVIGGMSFDGMDENSEKALKALETEIKSHLEKETKGYISETKFNELVAESIKKALKENADNENLQKKLKEMDEILVKQGLEIQGFKAQGGKRQEFKSLGMLFSDEYAANVEKVKSLSKGGWETFTVKAAGTMTRANSTGDNDLLTQLEAGFTRIARRIPFLRDIMNSASTTSQYIKYVEQTNVDGDAGYTGEGVKKSQIDFDLVTTSAEVKKITAFIKVSKEMLADIPFIQGEINNELMERINLKVDSGLLTDDGTGDKIKGILAFAPTFAAGGFAGTIKNANMYDALKCAITNIINANFMPNYILLNPIDKAKMEMDKDNDGNYIFPPFATAGGTNIAGVMVIENSGITEGTFVVGDFTKSNLRIREEANMQVGYENDDFTKNLITILAEIRLAHYIKNNHLNAFCQGTFTTVIDAIKVPVA